MYINLFGFMDRLFAKAYLRKSKNVILKVVYVFAFVFETAEFRMGDFLPL